MRPTISSSRSRQSLGFDLQALPNSGEFGYVALQHHAFLLVCMIAEFKNLAPHSWFIERRENGVLLVRIPSRRDRPDPLPDAVFTFRIGDPQYDFWNDQARLQEAG